MGKGAFRIPVYQGGSSSNPDPAIYCPGNGYIPDPAVPHYPFPIPESTPESLIFICDASLGNWNAATTYLQRMYKDSGSDNFLYEIFDTNGDLDDSFTSNADYVNYTFSSSNEFYIVKISISGTGKFTSFYCSDISPGPHLECIVAAIINSPNMGQFNLNGVPNCSTCELRMTTSNFAGLYSMFWGNLAMTHFNIPASAWTELTSIYGGFANTILRSIDLSGLDLDHVVLADTVCAGNLDLFEFKFPSNFGGKRCYNFFQNTPRLKTVQMPDTAANVGNGYPTQGYNGFFHGSGVGGEIIIPNTQYATSIYSMFQDAPNVEIVRFEGNWILTTVSNAFLRAVKLHTVEMPRAVGGTSVRTGAFTTANTGMRYYIGPDVGLVEFPVNVGLISITGDNDNSGHTSHYYCSLYTGYRTTLAEFNCPKLRVAKLLVGYSATVHYSQLNSLEIDWANSDWSHTSAPQLSISAAIDATEIDRIFTALPTVTGKTIDVRYSTGYAGCTPSIATAKGWTVL